MAPAATFGTRWSDEDFSIAERLGLEFSEDFELLKDIGWAKDDGRTEFEIGMPEHDLMELLQRLQGEAGMVLGGWAEEEREDVESKERFRRGYDVCEKVLADLDPRAGGRAWPPYDRLQGARHAPLTDYPPALHPGPRPARSGVARGS